MTYAQFKALVLAYMKRTEAQVNPSGVDVILEATNAARRWATRQHEFNQLKRFGYLQLASGDKTAWATVKPNYDLTGTAFTLQRVMTVHTATSAGVVMPGLAVYGVDEEAVAEGVDTGIEYMRVDATYLYHDTAAIGSIVALRGCEQLADLTTAATSDLFLDQYSDWLRLRVFNELNFYVADDQRVNISLTYMEQLWKSVVQDDVSKARRAVT